MKLTCLLVALSCGCKGTHTKQEREPSAESPAQKDNGVASSTDAHSIQDGVSQDNQETRERGRRDQRHTDTQCSGLTIEDQRGNSVAHWALRPSSGLNCGEGLQGWASEETYYEVFGLCLPQLEPPHNSGYVYVRTLFGAEPQFRPKPFFGRNEVFPVKLLIREPLKRNCMEMDLHVELRERASSTTGNRDATVSVSVHGLIPVLSQ